MIKFLEKWFVNSDENKTSLESDREKLITRIRKGVSETPWVDCTIETTDWYVRVFFDDGDTRLVENDVREAIAEKTFREISDAIDRQENYLHVYDKFLRELIVTKNVTRVVIDRATVDQHARK